MTLRIEGQPNWKVTTPRRRRGAAAETVAESVLPGCLQAGVLAGEFEVVEEGQLQGPPLPPSAAPRRGARRRAERAAGLTVTFDQPPGEPYVVVARQESGAISFHIPRAGAAKPARRGGRGARPAAALTVTIPLGVEPATVEPSAAKPRRGTRGIVDRVIKVVVMKVAQAVADYAIEKLGRLLEEKLWRDAQRQEGWVRVRLGEAGTVSCVPEIPTAGTEGRALLLLHGTFSHVEAAFQDLLKDPDTAARMTALYGDRIYGYQHFTISKTPRENVAGLLAALPKSLGLTCDVITHSRGGLVLRTLHRELTRGRRPDPRLTLGRVMLVASPNEGTPLATPQRWEQTLGWFANLLEMFPENPFTTAAGWISGSLSWLAQGLNNNLPGIQAMDANGETIQQLAQIPLTSNDEWYGLVADTRVPAKNGLAARLADMGVDAFFDGPNDLVVPTEGGAQWGASPAVVIPAARVGRYGPQGNLLAPADALVMHTTLFGQADTHRFLADSLQWPVVAGTTIPAAVRAMLPRPQLPTLLPGMMPAVSPPPVPPPSVPAKMGALETPVSAPVCSEPRLTREAPRAVLQGADQRRSTPGETAFSRQDSLFLVVLPLPSPPSPAPGNEPAGSAGGRSRAVRGNRPKTDAQLLASYSGASVLVPFHLRGPESGAGKRWQTIFAKHARIQQYADGTIDRELLEEDIRELGTALFETLFPDEVRRLYDQARFRDQRRKLNVVFTSMIPWVADLPWEFAFDSACGNYLATSDVRFVRGVLTAIPSDRIFEHTVEKLKILVVSAQPRSLAALSLEEEQRLVASSFQPLIDHGYVEIEVLAEATPDQLHARVRQAEYGEIDVVHFMGHGEFDEDTQTGYLVFENGEGGAQLVSTAHMRDILRSRGIKLVFLNACQSGQGSHADYNKGVAPGLVADGVPAVVANQYTVLDRSATTFAQHFYWCLAQGMALGDAARESRIALNYTGVGLIDWGVPVLFAREPDAVLCSGVRRREAWDRSLSRRLNAGPALRARRTGLVSSSREGALSEGAVPARTRVALWDLNSAIPDLDEMARLMNLAQTGIEFFALRKNAPFGAWKTLQKPAETETFLPAEQAARRLQSVVPPSTADFVLAITDLPLVSGTDTRRTVWSGTLENPNDSEINRITLFSSFGFQPPLRGDILRHAIVNATAQGLAWYWSALHGTGDQRLRHPEPALPGPAHRVLQHNDLEGTERADLRSALEKGGLPLARLDNLDALLNMVPATPTDQQPSAPARSTRPARAPRRPRKPRSR